MINALRVIAKLLLRSDVSVLERTSIPISNNFASKVDFIIKTPSGILVMDVKTTAMLDSVESLLSLPGLRIDLLSGASLEQKVVNKVCFRSLMVFGLVNTNYSSEGQPSYGFAPCSLACPFLSREVDLHAIPSR